MERLSGTDRLIVALDVARVADAISAVDELENVRFFKVGWQLFMAGALSGELRLLTDRLARKRLFIDLKLPGDIDNTIAAVVSLCVDLGNVAFLTVSESMPARTVAAAVAARTARHTNQPKLLTVPLVSSLEASDLRDQAVATTTDDYVVTRARAALQAGCDGVIVSGSAIAACRRSIPDVLLVSPGIRPAGASTDDHKRHTTPAAAILAGADYLVVGRPIMNDADRRAAAARVVAEIDEALTRTAAARHVSA